MPKLNEPETQAWAQHAGNSVMIATAYGAVLVPWAEVNGIARKMLNLAAERDAASVPAASGPVTRRRHP